MKPHIQVCGRDKIVPDGRITCSGADLICPAVEFRRQEFQDFPAGHAVEIVGQIKLLDDIDKSKQGSRRFFIP